MTFKSRQSSKSTDWMQPKNSIPPTDMWRWISKFFSTHLVILPDLHRILLFFFDMSLFGRFRQFFEHGLWTQEKWPQIMGIFFVNDHPFCSYILKNTFLVGGLHPKLICHNTTTTKRSTNKTQTNNKKHMQKTERPTKPSTKNRQKDSKNGANDDTQRPTGTYLSSHFAQLLSLGLGITGTVLDGNLW